MNDTILTPLGRCVYCGCSDSAEPFHYHFEPGAPPVRLWCSSVASCTARQEREAVASLERRVPQHMVVR